MWSLTRSGRKSTHRVSCFHAHLQMTKNKRFKMVAYRQVSQKNKHYKKGRYEDALPCNRHEDQEVELEMIW